MEIEIITGKFWILETKVDEKKSTQHIFDNDKEAIKKMKEQLKTIPAEKLVLLTVDVSKKEWQINQVSWQTIVTAMVNE